MQTSTSKLLPALVMIATSAAFVVQAPDVRAQADSFASAAPVRLALAERTTIYGKLEVVDESTKKFSIAGITTRLRAPEPTDISELENDDVKVTMNTEGTVLSVIPMDPDMLEPDDHGAGSTENTIIDGILEVEDAVTRVFRIAGLPARYHAPKDVDLPALDDQKVRAEIDADGNVSGLALFPSEAGIVPDYDRTSQG